MTIQIDRINYNERNSPKIASSDCLAIPEILEKIFMYSSLSSMGNLSQVNRSINQTAKTLQGKENYPKTYQKILLRVFAHLFKEPAPVGEISSCFASLSTKNKTLELKLLINSVKFNKIDPGSFNNILLQTIFKGHEQIVETLVNSQRFNEIDLGSFSNILLQVIHKGYEQVTETLVNSQKFNEIDLGSFSNILLQVIHKGYEQVTETLVNSQRFNEIDSGSFSNILLQVIRKGYEQVAETLVNSQRFNEIGLDSLGECLKESAEKGYVQIVEKIMDSSRFEEINGRDLGAALYQATLHKHEELAIGLLNVCYSKKTIPADPIHYFRNDWGESFRYAAQNGLVKFISRFITFSEPFGKIISNQLGSSLISSSKSGHLKVVEAIVASNRFHEITQDHLNKAYQASSQKHEQIAQILKKFST